jgi:acyl carrier protein phosphodiesterase
MATYTGIKTESTFPITVGGGTLVNLQKLLLYILADKTEEEINEAFEKILKKQFDEEWIEHYAFLAAMINVIEGVAREKGLTVEENLDESNEQGN